MWLIPLVTEAGTTGHCGSTPRGDRGSKPGSVRPTEPACSLSPMHSVPVSTNPPIRAPIRSSGLRSVPLRAVFLPFLNLSSHMNSTQMATTTIAGTLFTRRGAATGAGPFRRRVSATRRHGASRAVTQITSPGVTRRVISVPEHTRHATRNTRHTPHATAIATFRLAEVRRSRSSVVAMRKLRRGERRGDASRRRDGKLL